MSRDSQVGVILGGVGTVNNTTNTGGRNTTSSRQCTGVYKVPKVIVTTIVTRFKILSERKVQYPLFVITVKTLYHGDDDSVRNNGILHDTEEIRTRASQQKTTQKTDMWYTCEVVRGRMTWKVGKGGASR